MNRQSVREIDGKLVQMVNYYEYWSRNYEKGNMPRDFYTGRLKQARMELFNFRRKHGKTTVNCT